MKIYLAGERDARAHKYMLTVKSRLMTFYYHDKNSKEIAFMRTVIKKQNTQKDAK